MKSSYCSVKCSRSVFYYYICCFWIKTTTSLMCMLHFAAVAESIFRLIQECFYFKLLYYYSVFSQLIKENLGLYQKDKKKKKRCNLKSIGEGRTMCHCNFGGVEVWSTSTLNLYSDSRLFTFHHWTQESVALLLPDISSTHRYAQAADLIKVISCSRRTSHPY